jgi:hypothetical protein
MNWPPPWVSVQLRRAITLDGRNYPVGAVLRLSADLAELLAHLQRVHVLPAGALRRR